MAKDRSQPLAEINFHCGPCSSAFKGEPRRVEDAPENEHHPWRYFGACPKCGAEREQAGWERNLLKAWANATGPKTEGGRAATTANLEGHPTPEEALRTRFNGMKHGLSARTATYFPAKPDGYAFCASCDVDRVWCSNQPACASKTELFMLHHAAFEQRNPKHLMGIYADLQASIFAVLQQILQDIVATGVKIENPKYTVNGDGQVVVAEYIDESGQRRIIKDVQAHPLFRPLGELLSKTGLSLADMGMTMKAIDDEETELGQLSHERADQQNMEDYRARQVAALEAVAAMVSRAGDKTKHDPILIEYEQEGGG